MATGNDKSRPQRSEVAMWHELSGLPDDVTGDGVVVHIGAGQRLQSEKQLLRGAIEHLSAVERPAEVGSMARLAASYLVAGDVEMARRYVSLAGERLRKFGEF